MPEVVILAKKLMPDFPLDSGGSVIGSRDYNKVNIDIRLFGIVGTVTEKDEKFFCNNL